VLRPPARPIAQPPTSAPDPEVLRRAVLPATRARPLKRARATQLGRARRPAEQIAQRALARHKQPVSGGDRATHQRSTQHRGQQRGDDRRRQAFHAQFTARATRTGIVGEFDADAMRSSSPSSSAAGKSPRRRAVRIRSGPTSRRAAARGAGQGQRVPDRRREDPGQRPEPDYAALAVDELRPGHSFVGAHSGTPPPEGWPVLRRRHVLPASAWTRTARHRVYCDLRAGEPGKGPTGSARNSTGDQGRLHDARWRRPREGVLQERRLGVPKTAGSPGAHLAGIYGRTFAPRVPWTPPSRSSRRRTSMPCCANYSSRSEMRMRSRGISTRRPATEPAAASSIGAGEPLTKLASSSG